MLERYNLQLRSISFLKIEEKYIFELYEYAN